VAERSVFDSLKATGEELFAQVSSELMANPRFMKAMEKAWQGKQHADKAVTKALKNMNIPTRSEFKRALARIDSLEREVGRLEERLKKLASAKPTPRKRTSRRRSTPKAG
jgi:polyhydroxyalkanoate synthesis regulator phasin